MPKGANRARREMAEAICSGIAGWIEGDMERYINEVGEMSDQEGRDCGAARSTKTYKDPGLDGAFFRAWLYSGGANDEIFGPARPGDLKCVETRSASWQSHRTIEELNRDALYTRIVEALAPLDRVILLLWARAPLYITRNVAGWVAYQLGEAPQRSFRVNERGELWTPAAIRKRVTNINQVVAQRVLAHAQLLATEGE